MTLVGFNTWLAVDPAGQHVFVSGGWFSSSIYVLDFNGNIVKTITGEPGASQMALDASTHTLYVALHDANAIAAIDTTTLTETSRFSTSPFTIPSSLVIAAGKLWFSGDGTANGVVSANLDGTGIAAANLQSGLTVWTKLASGGATNSLLAVGDANSDDATAVYDVSQAQPALVSSSAMLDSNCSFLNDFAFDHAAANLLVACSADYLGSYSTTTLQRTSEYPTGNGLPVSVAVTADGSYVATGLGNAASPNVAVYPTGGDTAVRSWTLGGQPFLHAVAFSPDASRLFVVTDAGGGAFYVLDNPTVPIATTTSLSSSQQSIVAGGQVTLTAHVTGTATGTVDLYATPTGGSKTLLTTGSINASGDVTFTESPAVTTTYSARLEPGLGYGSSTSPDVTVTVLAATSVSLSPSQPSIMGGQKVTLTAHVTGTTTGTVDLYATPTGGSKTLLTTGSIDASGDVTFTESPRVTTAYEADLRAAPGYEGAASVDVTVTVVTPQTLTITVSRRVVTYGGNVKLTVSGVPHGTVDLYTTPNGRAQTLSKTGHPKAGQHTVDFTVAPRLRTEYLAELADNTAESNTSTIAVRPLLAFAVAAPRMSAKKVRRHHGEAIAIVALMKPAIGGQPLLLELDRAHSGGWQKLAEENVPARVAGVIVIKLRGVYRMEVRFAGDSDYQGVRSGWRKFRIGY